ncbi:MAG: glutathione S-transferase [Gammaproteobacteria bacterium]|nr:glutathione S-transferase [Gammaproteobacteria bacterium]
MKIYEFEGFPNPARVRMAVSERGLQDSVEYISVNVPAGEHRQPAFLKKNVSGTVPVLELDDGTTICECTAITEYLDHLNGAPSLTGASPRERGAIHMMQRRVEAGLLDAIGAYFHHATVGLGPDIETYQNPDWGQHQLAKAVATMAYLDGVLETTEYVAGDRFSMADITAIAGLGFAAAVGVSVDSAHTSLHAWHERVQARPTIAAA